MSAIRSLADAQLCFAGFEEWLEAGRLEALTDLSRRCWRTRGYGDFWQYMLVAEGAAEIALDPIVSFWDLAAPLVVVTEAGGRFTDLAGAVDRRRRRRRGHQRRAARRRAGTPSARSAGVGPDEATRSSAADAGGGADLGGDSGQRGGVQG